MEREKPAQERPAGHLLCVDDEANILTALRRLFRPDGYTIHLAGSGAEGLEILERESVDVIISDMRMPEMDGARFLERAAILQPEAARFLLTGYADLSSTIAAINQGHIYGYFSKPWEENELRLAVRHALEQKFLEAERRRLTDLTRRQNSELKRLNETLEARVRARTEELRQANLFLELAYEELQKSYFEAIPIFANLVQLREGPRGGHGKRVGELAQEIAGELGLDDETIRHIHFAGLLHDIGKIALPDDLLARPYADLSTTQRKVIAKHPVTGQAILMGLEPLQETARYIRHHHEQWDGRGYPDRLAGEEIPLGARIVAVANEYDGLRSGALLGEDLTPADARSFIEARRERRYDPRVVDALLTVLDARERDLTPVHELHLAAEELQAGMVLSRDLTSREGVLLLSRGYRLTEPLVRKIQNLERDGEERLTIHVRAEKEGNDELSHHAGR